MKEEMDATKWGDILADTLKDWAVPDVIENSATYKRLAASSKKHVSTRINSGKACGVACCVAVLWIDHVDFSCVC